MIPVGPERDKAILIAMGYKEVDAPKYWHCDSESGLVKYQGTDNEDWICPRCMLRPYSTDISCAMKLWEEMKEKSHEMYIIHRYGMVSCKVWSKNEPNPKFYFVGKTEADAISGAWLKWKEANQ